MRALVAALAVVSTATPAFAAQHEDGLAAQLDALVAPHFRADGPGAAVLVKKGDQVLLRKGYGMAQIELGVPMRPDYIFRIGSNTKQFTAAAIMMLVEEKKIALGDDIRKYVPEYPKKSATVTLEHLLTHTGGVPNYTEQESFHKSSREDLSHADLLATFKDLPLEFTPGDKMAYSNSGYYLLGMVIEKASGKSYAQFVEERIFKPLGMSHTSYGDDHRIVRGRAAGYEGVGDGLGNADYMSMALPFAAGSLISTVDDLALWDRAISDGKLLSKASWARMFTPRKLKDGSSTHYGFGWIIGGTQARPIIWHGGGIPGFLTANVRLPADGVVAIVLCNSIPTPVGPEELAFKLAATAIGKPYVEPKAVALAPAVLERYVGVYKTDDDKVRVVVRHEGDHLTLQRTGQGRLELTAASETSFFVKDKMLRFAFVRDAAGKVVSFDTTMPDGAVENRARTDEPLPADRAVVAVDGKLLDAYVGKYELAPGFVITVTRQGAQMFAQATGQPRFEIFATAPAEFFLKVVDAQMTFRALKGGKAEEMVLHQNGHDMPGKRVP